MAQRRLANLLTSLMTGNGAAGRNDRTFGVNQQKERAFVEQGTVSDVIEGFGTTSVYVIVRGETVLASQATDEPLRPGQAVWISQTENGAYVIHGATRG